MSFAARSIVNCAARTKAKQALLVLTESFANRVITIGILHVISLLCAPVAETQNTGCELNTNHRL
jgi:hypothetical protein